MLIHRLDEEGELLGSLETAISLHIFANFAYI